MTLTTDLDLTPRDITDLASPDALMSFLHKLGYETNGRTVLTPEALGLSGESANSLRRIELLSEDEDGFLRVIFAQPKSLTAKIRNDLVRTLGKSNQDHLLILASDFETLEFVFLCLDKLKAGPVGGRPVLSASRWYPRRSASLVATRPAWTCGRCAVSPGPARTPSTSSTSCGASSTPPPTRASTSRTGGCSPTISCATG